MSKKSSTAQPSELMELIDQVLGAFFELRIAGQRLGLVTESGGGSWGVLRATATEPMSMAELARRRGVSRQYIQKIATGLIERGYLELVTNPLHRRSALMAPTAAGHRALAAMNERAGAALAPLGESFSTRELKTAIRTLNKLRTRIAHLDSDAEPAAT